MIITRQLKKQVYAPEGILTILNDVNLEVHAGEAVAILGASGSGKSTLLGLLAGLDNPTAGDAILLQQNLNALDEDGRAQLRAGQVGFVFQTFQLLPAFTALENVMLPLELTKESQAKNQAIHLLTEVGLAQRLHHTPAQLSGGEQQRVAIARAFVGHPKLLFADEPTGNLDQTTGHKIIELLFQLKRHLGTALVLVTHDPELAAHCDKRYLLTNGELEVINH